jgi:type II secretory pathway component GspD/PulD (secretin)
MNKQLCSALAVLTALAVLPAVAADGKKDGAVRTIHLRQSDAQIRYESKVYELQNVTAESILPFINSAVMRYSVNSTVRRITSADGKREALLVSTGADFMPHVDKIIKSLDRRGNMNKKGIDGTGISRIAYTPRYRAASQFASIINNTSGSSVGSAYVNAETNTIFWRDQADAAQNTLKYVEKLDQPLPQVNVRLNYYELRDSDLKDWGFDYLAWKNGPGVNLFNVGYNAGKIFMDEAMSAALNIATSATWATGGFFTAPQFDMSFIRCLQQSGNASIASHAELRMLSTPVASMQQFRALQAYQLQNIAKAPFVYSISMTPEYQNIGKNTLGRTFVGKSFYEDENGTRHSDPPQLEARIINPFVCMPGKNGKGGVIFNYSLFFKNVVERGNTGSELSNTVSFSGAATLGFGTEKMLAVYEKENWVEQTIGLPILCRIPVLKYLFSTVTKIKERTYVVITAEVTPVDAAVGSRKHVSATTKIERRMDKPILNFFEEKKVEKKAAGKTAKKSAPKAAKKGNK